MKIGLFATANDKGQIVIPKEIRDILGIDINVTFSLTIAGNGIYLYPVEEFVTKAERESSYVNLLEKTKGSWKGEEWDEINKNRSLIELEASKLRKKPW